MIKRDEIFGWLVFTAFALATLAIYCCGLHGGFIFDDFPNIVDNSGIRPAEATIASLTRSALSSPSSEFKRPLASLSFTLNYLTTGMDPVWMKLTNVVLHLVNGFLAFILCRKILGFVAAQRGIRGTQTFAAALTAGTWLLLPINLTAVLYVVQRMESLANLFVLGGLIGYIHFRLRMRTSPSWKYFIASALSLTVATSLGLLAKETAVMLPLYAALIEALLLKGRSLVGESGERLDKRIVWFFVILLAVPAVAGLAWILPGLLQPTAWSTRNFTLGTRLLTEARVVVDYVGWTLFPTPDALSFYHDDFVVSTGLFSPWTTATSVLSIVLIAVFVLAVRTRAPVAALGVALFVGCHLLTGTILPLELVYEHRNYFASMGLLLAVVPWLVNAHQTDDKTVRLVAVRRFLLGILILNASTVLAITSHAWNDRLALAQELAVRGPTSPRAQYELGRTYIILSGYDASSPFTELAYAPLERAAALPGSSILPEQALIFLNARLGKPLKDAWWESMTTKLHNQKVGVQDESSLGALSDCMRQDLCHLPAGRLLDAYLAALSHDRSSARLLAMYSDFAWNQLRDMTLAINMSMAAVEGAPREPAYRVGLIEKLIAAHRLPEAKEQRRILATMNYGGALDGDLARIDGRLNPH